ncbi:hypothetical protein COU78_05075 [Candidatus Peregrinibacteria bacterium CG10_big_fil_rev_8_21_14_0_10_49_24]|nr:MAG: hypothetical protein COV83_01445 [Candidatus Peregrinibacteria bacterium CG11_big_fil_rev_8_21_14_0_20_49_14]PIR50720.1 MAG: hypothetical protein COU78_05075 [Candidatus Peregrinibacteria bacterium CG10_big_fil_rev_8_21_14_0_10_49_24]PJA68236.1 MAG: hypothetical protein CO157_00735 [Candidatus Peregrinibacteria bacterium CG_4_9_14_3_um_filter_49_12]
MSDIHPDWHTLDEDDMLVSVRAVNTSAQKEETAPPAKKQMHTMTVSRRPAAVFGILLVVGATTLFYQGVQNLTGQLAGENKTIEITEEGLIPLEISADRGETITWLNKRQVPQYIISDTLCAGNGDCLNTPTLFQGDSANYKIPQDVADGTYTYFSPTDPNLTGTITIGQGGGIPSQNSNALTQPPLDNGTASNFSVAEQSLLDAIQRQLQLDQTTLQNTQEPADEPEENLPPVNASGIPQNPYKVGSSVAPLRTPEYAYDDLPTPPIETYDPPAFAGDVQRPMHQPETGGAIWVVLMLSVAGILLLTRKSLQAYR